MPTNVPPKWDTSRGERKTRLRNEGRWDAFLAARKEAFQTHGLEHLVDAEVHIEDDFAPLDTDGGPPEPVERPVQGLAPGEYPGGVPDKRHTTPAAAQLKAEDWEDKTCSIQVAFQWVLDHLAIADADVKCDPPSALAVDMWRLNRKNDQARRQFYSDIAGRFLGSTPEVKRSGHSDDGSPVGDAINRLTKSLKDADQAGEPVLPGSGARAEGPEGES